jgi:hypothetical protein
MMPITGGSGPTALRAPATSWAALQRAVDRVAHLPQLERYEHLLFEPTPRWDGQRHRLDGRLEGARALSPAP